MSATGEELEVKFSLPDLKMMAEVLISRGGRLLQPRQHETNLRFDTPSGDLSQTFRVLRLRQDAEARLTYKGQGVLQDGVRLRQELEFTVSDFGTAQAVLEALGYQVILMYEKYRTTYVLEDVQVMLDEMPFGNFMEIEGPDGPRIQAAAKRLGLDWDRRILESYTVLFERVCSALGLTFRDLSFENFKRIRVTSQDLGVH